MKRWPRLEQVVDIDPFLTFMALEWMVGHWDGYCPARNNYRFYFDPKSGKIQFFPHGMDQVLRDPNYPAMGGGNGMVAAAVMNNPEWRSRYRSRLAELTRLFVPAERLHRRLDEYQKRLRPVLAEINPQRAVEFDGHVQALKERLVRRGRSLLQQNAVGDPQPMSFSPSGIAPLLRWGPHQESPDARVEVQESQAGGAKALSYTIAPGGSGRCIASWRTRVTLPAGKYRFEARARALQVQALEETPTSGLGIYTAGTARANKLTGTTPWSLLAHEFEVKAPTQEVELVAELRAASGQAWFDAGSLRLIRVGK